MSAFVIVDPRSGSGSTRRNWRVLEPALAALYPYMSVAFPQRRGEATALVAAALREGHSEIVAVGGDGTINEAINGFFDAEGAVSPDAVLAFVASGSEVFGRLETTRDPVATLKRAHVHPIDVGRVRFLSRDGIPRTRYFATVASFGLSGEIVDAVNRAATARQFGHGFAFRLHSFLARLRYRGRAVRLIVDPGFDEIVDITTVAVANGRVFGAGLPLAPDAQPDDGQFDVAVIARKPSGGNCPAQVIRGRKITAAPVAETKGRAVVIETDGQAVGRLPATFEILPRALNVRC